MRALLAIVFVAAFASSARADKFDPTGWKLLGADTFEHDGVHELRVARSHEAIDEVAVVVLGGIVTIETVKLRWDTGVAGAIEKAIGEKRDANDPGTIFEIARSDRPIDAVTLDIKTALRSRIGVFVRDSQAAAADASMSPSWSSTGWTELGGRTLRGTVFTVVSSYQEAAMDEVALVPTADLDVYGVELNLLDGTGVTTLREDAPATWKKGQAHIVDLTKQPVPSGIARVRFSYSIGGATRAKITLWGKLRPSAIQTAGATAAAAPSAAPSTSSLEGWTLLGEDEVDLVDDQIELSRSKSTWSKVAIVVVGDAVGISTLDLHFAGKDDDVQRTELDQAFEDGATRVIDIEGKRRAIEKVRLTYAKHRLDATTRVQVYAR